MTTTLHRATRADTSALAALFVPYSDELAIDSVIGDPARFLDRYWEDPGRHPYLIRHRGKNAGFAMVNRQAPSGRPIDAAMAEFFITPAVRHAHIGLAAARATFAAHPGQWELWVADANAPGRAFWASATDAPGITAHTTFAADDGTIHRFVREQS